MKNFEIIKLNASEYPICVFFTSDESPFSFINEVESELIPKQVSGKILFDVLFHTGNGNDRFIEVVFDGTNLELSSMQFVKIEKDCMVRKSIAQFLSANTTILENSILLPTQRYALSKGLSI